MELLKKISACPAPCGGEGALRQLIEDTISPFVDEITTDVHGSLIAHKKGEGKSICFMVPLDTPSLYVTYTHDKGFLRFSTAGEFDTKKLMGQKVVLQNGAKGVIYSEKEDGNISEMFIDIGNQSAEISDFVAFENGAEVLGDTVMGYAMGKKAAVYAAIKAIKENTKRDVYFVFTAKTAASLHSTAFMKTIDSSYYITLEDSPANDYPGEKNEFIKLFHGAVLKVKNGSMVSNPEVIKMIENCEENLQKEVSDHKGIASALYKTGCSVKYAGLGIPTRYKGSFAEVVALSDIDSAIKLITKLLQ